MIQAKFKSDSRPDLIKTRNTKVMVAADPENRSFQSSEPIKLKNRLSFPAWILHFFSQGLRSDLPRIRLKPDFRLCTAILPSPLANGEVHLG